MRFPVFLLVCLIAACSACKDDPVVDPGDLSAFPYDPKPYTIVKPAHFPEVPIPADNPLTVDGIQLGRRLFYDPILSRDSSQSCSSCHLPSGSFTDNKAVSVGVDGIAGRRSSMSLLNIAYATAGLFWDGRAQTLEIQATKPVEDPIEMHESWPNVEEKLRRHPLYPELFRKAFGISNKKEISKELAARAMAQFERILISSGTSKYDEFLKKGRDFSVFDDDELDGYAMFFEESGTLGLQLPDAQCFHCHGGVTLTGNAFDNNGLDSVSSSLEFKDLGRFEVTGNNSDKGKFRAPTLRNIALTGPYMHDGRFKTLEEVIDHYSGNGKGVWNENPNIRLIGWPIPGTNPVQYSGLTPQQKQALVKFMHTLTDTVFINNPDIQNPFK